MPIHSEYQYDVFISYAREDYDWAKALYDSLVAKGLSPFLDRERLQAGMNWERQLMRTLRESCHMIVLWSPAASKSDWVRREIGFFENRIYSVDSDTAKMIFLVLEGENTAFSSMQMILDVKVAGDYQAGKEELDLEIWRRVINQVESSLKSSDDLIPIPLLILATTHDRLGNLEHLSKPTFAPDIQTTLKWINLDTQDDLMQYYGEERTHWCPFCHSEKISSILDMLRDDINRQLKPTQIYWDSLDQDFWSSDIETAKREAAKLFTGLSVVIIDPLSLYDPDVCERLPLITPCFENQQAIVMVLAPFPLPEPYVELRKLIKGLSKGILDHFYEPSLDNKRLYAEGSVSVSDKMEIKRLLINNFRSNLAIKQNESIPPFLKY